jgi:hypothetical protein
MSSHKAILNIGIIIAIGGIFSLSSIMTNAQGQQQSSPLTVEELEAAKASIDQAIDALQNNNLTQTMQQIEITEDQLDTAEDKLEFQLGLD